MDDANGEITKSGVVIAIWMRGRTCWTLTAAWTKATTTPWQELEMLLQKLMGETRRARPGRRPPARKANEAKFVGYDFAS